MTRIVLTALLLIPVVGAAIPGRGVLWKYVLCVITGAATLTAVMVWNECGAADSDFDIMFGLSLMFWNALLAVTYAVIMAAIRACIRR